MEREVQIFASRNLNKNVQLPLGAGVDKLTSGPVTCNTISLFSFCTVLQVLEYALNTTNGQEPKNLVPIGARHPLITSWVFCKQMLNQQMAKNLGHDDEVRFCYRLLLQF